MSQPRLGVGFIGAGAVTQAIHLPTLARLTAEFEIRQVFDVPPTSHPLSPPGSGRRRRRRWSSCWPTRPSRLSPSAARTTCTRAR